jgi:hypothetical protein
MDGDDGPVPNPDTIETIPEIFPLSEEAGWRIAVAA